ncbi:sensor histidine kinase [Legionella spiritensis]|uniref:sensor histidine kinase n=1 Tax=Legionella spiritensis TaxID=452 RepID=UPI000F7147FF|nr:HAMP domain-containing sensor histidine kinase [Legionella spiritensis]VEG92533.1 Histidine kinase [Legionella spiritensis]
MKFYSNHALKAMQYKSLGDQVSRKISAWIFILVVLVITAIFSISFFLSRQMFDQQVSIWNKIAPEQALISLMDSDSFSINREINFLKSTGLFSSFLITDNRKNIIAHFGNNSIENIKLIPIKDNAKIVWGYYYFKPDFYRYISAFLIAGIIFLIIISLVYFVIKWRIKIGLDSEFSRFHNFLYEIEKLTEKLHDYSSEDGKTELPLKSSENNEQIIINRAINRLLEEINQAHRSLRAAIVASEQRKFQEELTKTALQVVHDIGSPIAILEIIQSTTSGIPEQNRTLLKNAIERIRDISNTLLKKARHDFSDNIDVAQSQQMAISIIEQVISEKRVQFEEKATINFNAGKDAHNIFFFVNSSELSRVISNLINNAVEAIQDDNRITVSLSDLGDEALIRIQDYGKGIPQHILSKLGTLGGSFGKIQGTGVGLNHAISTIKEFDGRLEIDSHEGQGTIVQIYLPKSEPSLWFASEIKISDAQMVVIIDDDEGIHTLWENKFKTFQNENKITVDLLHFYSPNDVIQWKDNFSVRNSILYLCDYEFVDSELNGIELIKKMKLNKDAFLVTSRLVNDVISHCESEKIKLLPKNIAHMFPIVAFNGSAL